ncbi:hypothetical protein [Streptomyces barkulensis]|uniref:hypothetical protein n=1 Tax=Streptomyces barkulensis TaxID=1257026 RepID=UPI000C6D8CFA|nr:hypothetical protein [Streptomyces barkulensis]
MAGGGGAVRLSVLGYLVAGEARRGEAEAALDVLEFADPDQRRFHHFRSALERRTGKPRF